MSVVKAVFVQVASEDHGIRGRPTNLSRVAAMTGMSRKEVRKIRDQATNERWTPDMELNPINSVIHYWHYDPDFSEAPGKPIPLPMNGETSFSSLVRRYAGDIPAGVLRKELSRAGTIVVNASHMVEVRERYYCPSHFHQDFVQNMAFALGNLAGTIVHNASLVGDWGLRGQQDMAVRRLERSAWTERLPPAAIELFKTWIQNEGARFVERADSWLGENELHKRKWYESEPRVVGVGVYYFEED